MQVGSGSELEFTRYEQRALAVAAAGAVLTLLWLMWSVGMGMLLGVLMAFIFRPIYVRMTRRWPPAPAALSIVVGSTLSVAFAVGALVWILVDGGAILGQRAVDSLSHDGGAQKIADAVAALTNRIGISTHDLEAKARTVVEAGSARAAGVAGAVAAATGATVLSLFFEMLTMYFVLRRWEAVITSAQDALPLRPDYTLKLLEEFRRVGRTTLLSTVFIGIVQGALATVGYVIVGFPEPLFFGTLTAVASLVPGVGTMIVWVPSAVVLVMLGHVGRSVTVVLWGVLVLSAIPDYLIRPRLVGGKDSDVPALFTFTALFGGAAVLGLKGLILGPVLMALALAILRLYTAEKRARRHAAVP